MILVLLIHGPRFEQEGCRTLRAALELCIRLITKGSGLWHCCQHVCIWNVIVVDLGTALPGVDSILKIVISIWELSVLASCPTSTTYFLCMTLGRKLNNLCLSFFICKMGTLLMPNPLSLGESDEKKNKNTLSYKVQHQYG